MACTKKNEEQENLMMKNGELQDDDLESVAGGAFGKQVTLQGKEVTDTLNSGGTVSVDIPVGGTTNISKK